MTILSKEQQRRNMQAVKSKGSKIETLLGKEMWKKAYDIKKMTSPFSENLTLHSKNIKLPFFATANFGTAKIGKQKSTSTRPTLTFGIRKMSETLKEM